MSLFTSRRTPVNDEYPTCERTCAQLLVYSGEITPDEVSQRLGLSPTDVRTRGSTHTNTLGRTRTCSLNGWFLSTEGVLSSKDLRRHLDWLLEVLEPKAQELLQLQNEPGVYMTVNCPWWSKTGQGGPTLWPEQMARLARLNLECTFDVAFFDEEEEAGGQSSSKSTIAS